MYIDRQRSWFLHGDSHAQRCEGGIVTGATVGVLLDLDRHQLSFYVNEEPQVSSRRPGAVAIGNPTTRLLGGRPMLQLTGAPRPGRAGPQAE